MKRCPYCAEDIKFEAIKCRYCGSMLEPSTPIPTSTRPEPPSTPGADAAVWSAPEAGTGDRPAQASPGTIQRVGRVRYVCRSLGSFVLYMLGLVLVAVIFPEDLVLLPIAIGFVALCVYQLVLVVGRAHDLGYSGLAVLTLFVPVVSTVASLVFLFAPGEPGPNVYGDPPAPNTALENAAVGTLLAGTAAIMVIAMFA